MGFFYWTELKLDLCPELAGQVAGVLPIGDVGATANSILGVLKPKLSLNETQTPRVLEAVTGFLQSKSGILDLATSNPTGYATKFGGIKDKLFSTLKTALTANQFKNMLSLKPKSSSSGDVLSHLFF
ncbi:hypothetical protein [Flavitalea sp.]|nr:hypothetical protein [Flavitalea sp.]